MKSKILGLLAVGILAGPLTANASTYLLTATPLFSNFSAFTVTFNDTGDGELQLGEVIAFSGVTYLPLNNSTRLYSTLLAVPTIAGISTCGPSSPCNANDWRFGGWSGDPSDAISPPQSQWSYARTTVTAPPVPLPAAAWLLLSGLGGLGLLARRRKA